MYLLMLQTRDPLLKDPRVRRAIALTIDAGALAKAVSWGTAPGNNSPFPLASPFHDSRQFQRRPDIATARRLLTEAGYRGEPITLITNRRNPQQFDVAVLVQAMAAQAGINFEIQILDWASEVDRYASGKYQAMSFAFSAKSDPSLSFGLLIGDKDKEPRKVWDSAQAIALLKRSTEVEAPQARRAVLDELNAAFMREVPAVVLYSSTRIAVTRDKVNGFRIWPAAQTRLWNVGFAPGKIGS
jgi:peptide/nickel transport system substrate-binding protein